MDVHLTGKEMVILIFMRAAVFDGKSCSVLFFGFPT